MSVNQKVIAAIVRKEEAYLGESKARLFLNIFDYLIKKRTVKLYHDHEIYSNVASQLRHNNHSPE